jgi:hypothetical protein
MQRNNFHKTGIIISSMAVARDLYGFFYSVQISRMCLMSGNLLRHRKWRFKRGIIKSEPVLNLGRWCRMNSIKTFLSFCRRIDTLSFLWGILESLFLFILVRKRRTKLDEIHYTLLLKVSTFIMWSIPQSKTKSSAFIWETQWNTFCSILCRLQHTSWNVGNENMNSSSVTTLHITVQSWALQDLG